MMHLLAYPLFYAIGLFPTGMLIARSYGIDIASQGSGNVGATNVARTIGKKAGIITLAGDVLKGVIAVLIAKALFAADDQIAVAGLIAVCGHCFSIPGKLKGGKGVATALGVLFALSPTAALIAVLSFAIVFGLSQTVSIASITAALTSPLAVFFLYPETNWGFAIAAIGLLLTWRHKENIQRIIEGREPKFSLTRK